MTSRSGGRPGRQAAHHQPVEPRRVRRFQPRDVRGRAQRLRHVLLCDDDIVIEPESNCPPAHLRHALHQADARRWAHVRPVQPHLLHTLGENVNPWRWQPGKPIEEQVTGHDLAASTLRNTAWMHRRVDVDYNGWWMELIPTQVIREIKTRCPSSSKWDDVEYGLRAKAAGYPTVSFPGAAVWRISWGDKDDLVDWQAYFRERNRLIGPHPLAVQAGRTPGARGPATMDVEHLISMQYYTEAGRIMALHDVLAGPDPVAAIQPQRIKEIRAMTSDFSDAQFSPRVDDFPAPLVTKPPRRGKGFNSRPSPAPRAVGGQDGAAPARPTRQGGVQGAAAGRHPARTPRQPVVADEPVRLGGCQQRGGHGGVLVQARPAAVAGQTRRGHPPTARSSRTGSACGPPTVRRRRTSRPSRRGARRSRGTPTRSSRAIVDRRQLAPGKGQAARRLRRPLPAEAHRPQGGAGPLPRTGHSVELHIKPAVQFAVFYVALGIFLGLNKGMENYAVYLFSGIIAMNFFNEAFGNAIPFRRGQRQPDQEDLLAPRTVPRVLRCGWRSSTSVPRWSCC